MRNTLLLALALSTGGLVLGDGATNALPNPGFEEGLAHWTIHEDTSQVVGEAARTGTMGLRTGAERVRRAGS